MRDVWDSPLFISFCRENRIYDQIHSIFLTFSADGEVERLVKDHCTIVCGRHQSISKMGAVQRMDSVLGSDESTSLVALQTRPNDHVRRHSTTPEEIGSIHD